MATLPDKIPEILAPAGGRAQFFAALNAGADAVYLGLKAFNARARAENFTVEDLRELVPLAHCYGMKVLVTLNVLIKDQELGDLVRTMAALEDLEVDAVIVQDLAVARIARAHFPALRLHASTQLAVHNLAGVEMARELGFRRVVLARELTALEVKKIRAQIPRSEVELEVFCHGSLCYSYSGLCFFSGAEDARSGNRGECAYTCRQPYKIVSEEGQGFLFSMKDLDTSASLDLLATAGVDTLKIEGRKKDAQYVASTVTLYRKRLDDLYGFPTLRQDAPTEAVRHLNDPDSDVQRDLALSFHRQRTSLFLRGRYHENVIDLENPTHLGLPLGTVSAVQGSRITLKTECAIERFDGLRVVETTNSAACNRRKWENDRLEFSLRDLRVGGQRATEARAGELVEIDLPEGTTTLPVVGDLVHKVRSADLKRRVTALTNPPADAKMKPVRLIEIGCSIQPAGDRLRLLLEARKFGVAIASAELTIDLLPARGPSTLAADVHQVFGVFGELGFLATTVEFNGPGDWFVPRAKLKALKQLLGLSLERSFDEFLAARLERALEKIDAPSPSPLKARAMNERRFVVKSDRLETLEHAVSFANANAGLNLAELVFEPKRSSLADLNPQALGTALKDLTARSGTLVRLAFPTVIRAWDEPLLKRWFAAAADEGIADYEIGNIGALKLLRDWGLAGRAKSLSSDFTLYSLNSCTSALWRELGLATVCLSIEDDARNLAAHVARLPEAARQALQVIVYKDTPLFIAEACSLTALHKGCPTAKVCGYRTLEIENPKGERFFVAHESCKSIVYGKDAYSLSAKQTELLALGLSNMRVDFLTREYDESGVQSVLAAVVRGEAIGTSHSANFERTLL